jgi:hypothetical protein
MVGGVAFIDNAPNTSSMVMYRTFRYHPRKKSHAVYTEKYFPCKEDKNTYSTTSIHVPHNNSSQSAELSCRHVEQVLQISCDTSTEPIVLTIDDASNGVSMLA